MTAKSKMTSTASSQTKLPHPADLPDAEVVIFDGKCKFCQKQVGRLFQLDGRNRLSFLSLHDPLVQQNFPDLTYDMLMKQMYLVTRDHRRLAGAAAIRYLSTRLPKLWLLAPLLHIPGSLPVWQFLYNQIAKRRYRIAGKMGEESCENGTCELHFKD